MSPILANAAYDFLVRGGPIMIPILLCCLMAVVVILERSFWWRQHSRRSSERQLERVFAALGAGRFDEARELSQGSDDPFLATVHEGIVHAHSSLLGAMQLRASDELEKAEARLWILSTFITLAPLLGLLGTVIGIMGSFSFVGQGEIAAIKLGSGIGEALIATAFGLGIAMLCLLPYNYFNRRLGTLRARLERSINHAELLVEAAKHHGHDLEDFSRRRALQAAGDASREAL
ncbi:MAG: hypothetical protein RL095_2034 [Verrucomicrobiota bacterium]|jgi:biopolymer transport protein ExbB